MKGSAILTVGDEILCGRIVDSNAAVAARLLAREGFPVLRKESVGDDTAEIAAAIKRLQEIAGIVVVSGGIGPTPDDVTRFGVAEALGAPLESDAEALAWLAEYLSQAGRKLLPQNEVQALLPRGTHAVRNPLGTACGILSVGAQGNLLFVGPGVPREWERLLECGLVPLLRQHEDRGEPAIQREVTLFGLPESEVGRRLNDLMARGRDPIVGCYPQTAGQVLVISSRGAGAEDRLERDVSEICARLQDAVIATRASSLAEVLLELLASRGETLATAESLTGGRVADLLVSVPGASRVFQAGFCPYANAAKWALLGVSDETLNTKGAVSLECAAELALGARARTGCSYAVSLTGVAGPTGGSPEKPVGLVYFGVASARELWVLRRQIPGGREEIRERAAHTALDLVRLLALGKMPEAAMRLNPPR